jgi:hypothetical protein
MKLSKDNPLIVQTRLTLDLLCDTRTLLTMSCVLPLLEAINALIKFVQRRHAFICDFVVVVQIWQVDFFMMWFDSMTNHECKHFQIFCDVVDNNLGTITQDWFIDFNTM